MRKSRNWLTLREVADQFGVSVDTVRRRIAEGSLPAYRLAGRGDLLVRDKDARGLAQRVARSAAEVVV